MCSDIIGTYSRVNYWPVERRGRMGSLEGLGSHRKMLGLLGATQRALEGQGLVSLKVSVLCEKWPRTGGGVVRAGPGWK